MIIIIIIIDYKINWKWWATNCEVKAKTVNRWEYISLNLRLKVKVFLIILSGQLITASPCLIICTQWREQQRENSTDRHHRNGCESFCENANRAERYEVKAQPSIHCCIQYRWVVAVHMPYRAAGGEDKLRGLLPGCGSHTSAHIIYAIFINLSINLFSNWAWKVFG